MDSFIVSFEACNSSVRKIATKIDFVSPFFFLQKRSRVRRSRYGVVHDGEGDQTLDVFETKRGEVGGDHW